MNNSYISSGESTDKRCIICDRLIVQEKDVQVVESDGLTNFLHIAARWKNLDERVCAAHPYDEFHRAHDRIVETESKFVHTQCRINFRNRIGRKETSASKLPPEEKEAELSVDGAPAIDDTVEPPKVRLKRKAKRTKKICTLCETEHPTDNLAYNEGGVGRCEKESSEDKLKESMNEKLLDANDELHESARRLELLLIGTGNDVFAADVYYHKDCYNMFVTKQKASNNVSHEETDADIAATGDYIKRLLFRHVESRIIKDQDAFLLREIVTDVNEISKENGLLEPPVELRYGYMIRRSLTSKFGENIAFTMMGRNCIVHSSQVNALQYTKATLSGHGLREDETAKAFANLIRRKLSASSSHREIPTPEDFFKSLDEKVPVACIFNAIAWSVKPRETKNQEGFVGGLSNTQAEKIYAISEAWERLITKERTPMATARSLTIHRDTGCKEAIKINHKSGFGDSYTDIRHITNKWSSLVSHQHKKMLPPGFIRGRAVHVTFDNSDGKQQTITGANTTHHTTGTIFQARYDNDEEPAFPVSSQVVQEDQGTITEQQNQGITEFGSYNIPQKRKTIPRQPDFNDRYANSDLLQVSLRRDIAWVAVGTLGDRYVEELLEIDPNSITSNVGSWTAFMKDVAVCETIKCKLKYLPVVPFHPDDKIIKWYLDMMISMAEELGIDHLFAHADEAIYSKMVTIIWQFGDRYKKIIPLIGGFHTLLVFLKILYKKYSCLGIRDWWVEAGAIKEGSVDKAIEGRHYERGIKLHKQSFNALLRIKIDQILPGDVTIKKEIANLRLKTNTENLNRLLELPSYKLYCQNILKSSDGTQSKMMHEYLKDVSCLFSLIFSVREKWFELHIAAQRAMLPKCFAFNHINYSRYLTVQHVFLENLRVNNKDAWDTLVSDGFGGSLSGQPFSTIHGDLITEVTINREVKVRGGPMRGGYSTADQANDAFIKTSHLMATVRSKVKEKLQLVTSSVHKELTPGARKKHDDIVKDMKSTMEEYFDPFLDGPARHMKTGAEIDGTVVLGLLSSNTVGENMYNQFVEERIKCEEKERKSIFEKITKSKIRTGLEKKKKKNQVLDVVKEDRQAFGLLVGRVASLHEALSYPVTCVPLALAEPDMTIRQQNTKCTLRRHMYEESNALTGKTIVGADWFVDAMMAVKAIPVKTTYEEFADAFLRYCSPDHTLNPKSLSIVFDSYRCATPKQSTQKKRGEAGRRVHITNIKQKMPCSKADWEMFLQNPENKMELIQTLAEYFKSPKVRNTLNYPLVVNAEEKVWKITNDAIEQLPSCNHIEADTRLILEASKSRNPVVVRASDTDVFLLMLYAHQSLQLDSNWQMKIDNDRYICINTVRTFYGDEVCSILPAYHSITGCDTTSYPVFIGKVKPFKKMVRKNDFKSLKFLGTSVNSFRNVEAAKHFLHTVMYDGKEGETVTDTRVRTYLKQKTKSSTNLIPDEKSAHQHLLRSDNQCFQWLQCMKQNMIIPPVEGRGWFVTEDGEIKPVWYDGEQLPPSLNRRKSGKSTKDTTALVEGHGTDSEVDLSKPKKRRTATHPPPETESCDDEEHETDDDGNESYSEGSATGDSEWMWLESETSDDDIDPDW